MFGLYFDCISYFKYNRYTIVRLYKKYCTWNARQRQMSVYLYRTKDWTYITKWEQFWSLTWKNRFSKTNCSNEPIRLNERIPPLRSHKIKILRSWRGGYKHSQSQIKQCSYVTSTLLYCHLIHPIYWMLFMKWFMRYQHTSKFFVQSFALFLVSDYCLL